MASKVMTSAAFLLVVNLLFFTLVSSTHTTKCPPPPRPPPSKCPPSPPPPSKCPPPPKPHPPPTPTPTPTPSKDTCPIDTLKLGVCANVLNGLLGLVIGSPASSPACCSLISGLADLDAAVCLCTALKANVLGINLNIPIDLSLLVNYCGKKVPSGFQCA